MDPQTQLLMAQALAQQSDPRLAQAAQIPVTQPSLGGLVTAPPTLNQNPYSLNDLNSDMYSQMIRNDYDDPTQNQNQGPTPLNQSNYLYARSQHEPVLWNGPIGRRGN